jgi:CelD/BcsL family acetyltransferase involved in cellulose biosynthesis
MEPAWRKKLDYARRRLARDRPAAFHLADAASLAADAATLRRLHAARWAERGETGVLDDPPTAAFLERALPALLADGLLRLHRLEIEGELAAAILALQAHSGVFVYITGFDPAFGRYSPGALLWAEVIETAAREGAREVHFLRGQEAYKRRWGAEDRPTWRRTLTRI